MINNKTIVIFISVLMILSFLTLGCIEDDEEYNLNVVVTIPPQKEWVKNIGGDDIKVTVMIPPNADVHTYEPTPSQMKELENAHIYFKVGSGIEFEQRWMDTLIEQNPDMIIVDGSRGIDLLDYQYDDTEHGDDHHNHESSDPHIWLSPLNAKIMINNFLKVLKEVNPENNNKYLENGQNYLEKLDTLHEDIKESLKIYEGRKFMIYHPSMLYFAHEYGLKQIAVEREGREPGSRSLETLIEQAKEENISVVFVSPQFDETNAQIIAEEIDGKVYSLNPLAEDYIDNLNDILSKLLLSFESDER